MSVFTSANTARTFSLNGWWDFCPCAPDDPMLVIPAEGWEEDAYLAPSSWTGAGAEAFAYPVAWRQSRQAWLRRFIRIARRGNRRAVLRFDGVGPRTTVFLNGMAVGEAVDGFVPFEVDITDATTPNANELVLCIRDTPRDERGRARHPAGRAGYAGIWQDARIVERAEVCVANTAIRTSVRQGLLSAEVELTNASRRARTVTVHHDVVGWKPNLRLATATSTLALDAQTVTVPPRGSAVYKIEQPWPQARLWSPAQPHLHTLRFRIEEGGHALFVQGERFGFREVWAEGSEFFLNGAPLRLFSDNGPAPALHQGTEAWVRGWFQLLRATGLNHARLRGGSLPRIVHTLADEEGMLLTVESALDGEASALAVDSPEFWVHAADHLRRLVLRDRNHPSIVLWSIAHNLVTDLTTPSPVFRELPRLRALVRELDPTRLAYFDGDSMHWQPEGQDLLDGQPGRYESIYDAPAHPRLATAFSGIGEAARYIALARANGAAGIAVQSPNAELPRVPRQPVKLPHADWAAPGLKLPTIPAGVAEFDFWSASRNPRLPPSPVLRAYADAFRPVAAIDTTPATAVYAGQTVRRRVVVCNDTIDDLRGTLQAAFRFRDAIMHTQTHAVEVARGRRTLVEAVFEVPAATPAGMARLEYALTDAQGRRLDRRRIPFRVAHIAEPGKRLAGKGIVVVGPGALRAWLERSGIAFTPCATVEEGLPPRTRVVVLEPGTVKPGSDQLPMLRDYVRRGGALVVLEQDHTLFTGLEIVRRSSWLATRAAPDDPVFAGLVDEDLVCWDNRPVAASIYLPCAAATTLAQGAGGALLVSFRDGKGLVLATQLRIPRVLDVTPAASQLLFGMLSVAAAQRGAEAPASALLEGDFTPVPRHAGKGYAETFWVRNAPTAAAMAAQLVAATVRTNADFPPVLMFAIGDRWETVHRTNGWASAAASSLSYPIYLYSRIHADALQSALRLEGEGAVEVSVGGRTYTATLAEGAATIADIALQRGFNAVLVLWKPSRAESRLRAIWCDAHGAPQTAFTFV